MAAQAKSVLGVEKLEAVADRGYFNSDEILKCEEAGITVTLPKPITSGIEAKGRFGKQDFVYLGDEDVYRCPAGDVREPLDSSAAVMGEAVSRTMATFTPRSAPSW